MKNIKTKKKGFVIYQAKNSTIEFHDFFSKDTIWETHDNLVYLYEKDQFVISRHINNIFKDNEVVKKSNSFIFSGYYSSGWLSCKLFSTVIEFRKWATKILKQHVTEGYTINKRII